jgi:hypothetical protein
MPQPNRRRMRCEAAVGCAVVAATVATCITVGHAGTGLLRPSETAVGAGLLAAIYAQALLALGCLLGVLLGDPGMVRRSTAQPPVPAEVAARLAAGRPLEGLANVDDPVRLPTATRGPVLSALGPTARGGVQKPPALPIQVHGSYCVRCCVWRPLPPALQAVREARLAAGPCGALRRCWTSDGGRNKPAHHCAICQRCVR